MQNRVCTNCKDVKSLDKSNYRRYSAGNYHSICRDCEDTIKKNLHNDGNGNLLCVKCNKYLDPTQFHDSTHKHEYRLGKEARCKKCRTKQSFASRSIKTGSAGVARIVMERLLSARLRSKTKGLDIDITSEFLLELILIQNNKCAISGIEMTYGLGVGRIPTNMSIDRIDPEKGYTKENVQLVCMAINQMKSDLSMHELYDFCEAILHNKSK